MEIHELANLIPEMSDGEYEKLRDDIKANGLIEPITTYEGKILDGRHRYRACQETGVRVDTKAYTGDDPWQYVRSLNIHRRHLKTHQLADIALGLSEYYERDAKRRMSEGGHKSSPGNPSERVGPQSHPLEGERHEEEPRTPIRATDEVAAAVGGISGKSVQRMKRIKQNAPDLYEKVMNEEMTINAAEAALKERILEERIPQKSREETQRRYDTIKSMATEGYRNAEIASTVDMSETRIRDLLNKWGIDSADRKIGKAPRIKVNDVMERIIADLMIAPEALAVVRAQWNELDRDRFSTWAASLNISIRSMQKLRTNLQKETIDDTED